MSENENLSGLTVNFLCPLCVKDVEHEGRSEFQMRVSDLLSLVTLVIISIMS